MGYSNVILLENNVLSPSDVTTIGLNNDGTITNNSGARCMVNLLDSPYANHNTFYGFFYIEPGTYSVSSIFSDTSMGQTAPANLVGCYVHLASTSNPAVEFPIVSPVSSCKPPKYVEVSTSSVAPNGEVTLSWREASAGTNNAIIRYEIYRATSASGSYEYIGAVITSSTSGQATVKAPSTNGSSYYYKIKTIGSVSGYDSELSSAYATLTCSYSAPSTPQNITIGGDTIAYAKAGNTVLLSWNAASDGTNNPVAGYVVYRDGVEYGQTGGTSMSVPVNETAGSYHTYTVYTKGAYSTSASSEAVRVYTYSDPTAPVIVNVNGSDSAYVSAGDSVTLTWSGANSGKFNSIVGYKVYQNGNEYATTVDTYLVVPAGSNTGDEYTYSVMTLGERTNSDTSKEVRVYSYSAVSAPSTVNISNLSPDAGSELTLFFSGAKAGEYNAITGYKVYEDVGATGAYNLIASISSTETSGTHKLFAVSTMATTCRYRVSTVGVYGESRMSSVYAEYTTKSYGACTPPTSVTITKNNSEAGGTARLYWSGAKDGENSNIVRYAVYRSIHYDRDYEKILETDQTYTDVTASDTEGQIYYFKVRAIAEDQAYNSELSDAYAWIKTDVSTGNGGNSVPASAAFHAAIKNGAKQRALIYFYDDGLWLTDVTIDDVPKLNGKSADQYMLKTDTAADSANLGGKAPEYYLQTRNLLDNSWWKNPKEIVNQRGETRKQADLVYWIDRWLVNTTSAAAELRDGGIYLPATTSGNLRMVQRIPIERIITGQAYTLAVCESDGTIRCVSGVYNNDVISGDVIGDGGMYIVLQPAEETYVYFIIDCYKNFTIRWAALYEGSYTAETLPPYVPKGYAQELAECQRYYQFYSNTSFAISVWGSSTSQASITVFMPNPMRVDKPTVNILNVSLCIDGSGNSKTVTLGGVINPNVNSTSIRLRINADTSWTKGDVGTLIANVELSADL